MVKSLLRTCVLLLGVLMGLASLVQLCAWATLYLSGTRSIDLDRLEDVAVPQRHPTRGQGTHRVSEWHVGHSSTFYEAPQLAASVKAGHLPPVDQRLPQNPLVIVPPQQRGPYGGTWVRFASSPRDVGIFPHRIAYEGFLRWDPMGQKLLPNLASRWEIGDNGRTFTFHLRRGVRWSDGQPFTANDILFWYRAVLLNQELTPIIPATFRSQDGPVRVKKIDPHTVCFEFSQPQGLFLKRMASGDSLIVASYPAHYLRQYHPDYADTNQLQLKLDASGFSFWYQFFADRIDWRNVECPRLWAWVVKQPAPMRPVVFERNSYYWKVDPEGNQLPYIDRIHFEIYDPVLINQKAIEGAVGMQARHLKFRNYPVLMENRERGGYRILHWIDGTAGQTVIAPNMNHKDPFLRRLIGDHRFRIALSHAINRHEINEAVYFGIGKPRQIAPTPQSPSYSADFATAYTEYNPQKARRMLDELCDELGLRRRDRDGQILRPDNRPLAVTIETTPFIGAVEAFELVAGYWTAVGVKTTVKVEGRELFRQRALANLHDFATWEGSDELRPMIEPRWFFPYTTGSYQGPAYARWFQSEGKKGEEPPAPLKRCQKLYRGIESTIDEQEQLTMFEKILEINRRNLYVIGLVGEVPVIFVVDRRFRNVPHTAAFGWIFRSPAATAPECYAIDEAQRRAGTKPRGAEDPVLIAKAR